MLSWYQAFSAVNINSATVYFIPLGFNLFKMFKDKLFNYFYIISYWF